MSSVITQSSKNSYSSQVSSYLNKAKSGGYSKLSQAKSEAQTREALEKMENLKAKERQIIKEKKLREQMKEKKMAEERLKKISEEQNLLKQKKDQQKEFYQKFLRQTAEQNLKKIEEIHHQNIHKIVYDNKPQQVQSQQQLQQLNQNNSSKFVSKIPRPNFSGKDIRAPEIKTKEQEKKLVETLNGLNLELTQTKRQFNYNHNSIAGGISPKQSSKITGLLEKGDLIESLDLNIGYESIQKLKDNWGGFQKLNIKPKPKQQTKKEEAEPDFDRDSLNASGSSDEESKNDGGNLKDDELKLLGQKKSNKDWIEQSVRQSVSQWKEMMKFGKENQDINQEQPNHQQPLSWLDQEYNKNQQVIQQIDSQQQKQQQPVKQSEKPKSQEQQQRQPPSQQIPQQNLEQQKKEEDQFTFGQKLQQLDQQNIQQKPPKPVGRSSSKQIDDGKSGISKVSRASSKSSRLQAQSSSGILSKEEELKQAKEKKDKLDQIKKQYTQVSRVSQRSKSKNRSGSQNRDDATTKCTREEDINIDEFMKDDLRAINKEEEKLQREILNIHKQNLHKHHQVVSKNGIDTNIQNTEQLIRKMVNAPQLEQTKDSKNQQKKLIRPGVNEGLENQIEESLENLDNLLNNIKNGDASKKEQEIMKIGKKYNIDFNLGDDQQQVSGYSKKNNQQKVFEYQQPFNIPSQPQFMQQPIQQQQQVVQQQQQQQLIHQNPSAAINQQQTFNYVSQQRIDKVPQQQQNLQQLPINNQFQPFSNMDAIANLYNQQQKIQQLQSQFIAQQQQQMTFQQNQNVNLAPQFKDPYAYNISGQAPKEITFQKQNEVAQQQQQQYSFKSNQPPAQQEQQQFQMSMNEVRSNKDILRMRKQQQQQQQNICMGNSMKDARESQDIDFNQYSNDDDDDGHIEDSLNDQKTKANAKQSKNIATGNFGGGLVNNKASQQEQQQQQLKNDVVKINPRFNMKILFDDE